MAGLIEAAIGGFLIYRGTTGQCAVYQALGLDTYHADGRAPADEIAEKGVHVEQSMLIREFTEHVLDQAIRDCAGWPVATSVAVNLSARSLLDGELMDCRRDLGERPLMIEGRAVDMAHQLERAMAEMGQGRHPDPAPVGPQRLL